MNEPLPALGSIMRSVVAILIYCLIVSMHNLTALEDV